MYWQHGQSSLDILIIRETELDSSFPDSQFYICISVVTILYFVLTETSLEKLFCCMYEEKFPQRFWKHLTLSWWRPLSYRNQSIELFPKLMDWFLYDNDLRHERFNGNEIKTIYIKMNLRNKNGY